MDVTTDIVRASEIKEKVLRRIVDVRYAAQIAQYEKDLKAYERALKRGKTELTEGARLSSGEPTTRKLYQVVKTVDGVKSIEAVYRPQRPNPSAWLYSNYGRSMGYTSKASQWGFLANPLVNREILPRRVEEYGEAMEAGRWHDLLSDPITITSDGHVVNGQHRLAAIAGVDWEKVENDPLFLVVFGVDPREAIMADTSAKRTARDQTTIAAKVLQMAA